MGNDPFIDGLPFLKMVDLSMAMFTNFTNPLTQATSQPQKKKHQNPRMHQFSELTLPGQSPMNSHGFPTSAGNHHELLMMILTASTIFPCFFAQEGAQVPGGGHGLTCGQHQGSGRCQGRVFPQISGTLG